jgi:hypothetical protein
VIKTSGLELSPVAKRDRLKMIGNWKGWSGCGNAGSRMYRLASSFIFHDAQSQHGARA